MLRPAQGIGKSSSPYASMRGADGVVAEMGLAVELASGDQGDQGLDGVGRQPGMVVGVGPAGREAPAEVWRVWGRRRALRPSSRRSCADRAAVGPGESPGTRCRIGYRVDRMSGQTRPVTIAPAPLGSPAAGALIAALVTFEYLHAAPLGRNEDPQHLRT